MKTNKDLVIEPNASLQTENIPVKSRGPVSTATGGREEQRMRTETVSLSDPGKRKEKRISCF